MKEPVRIREFEILSTESGPDMPVFDARFHNTRNPRNQHESIRLSLDCPDWVNIIAITPQSELVVVFQYRSGVKQITCEIPGGVIDPGEESYVAAERELREETGYTTSHWQYLGSVQPNPAIHNNRCHHWLARDVMKTNELSLDEGEDIQVGVLTYQEVSNEVANGRFRHSLALSALSRVPEIWTTVVQSFDSPD